MLELLADGKSATANVASVLNFDTQNAFETHGRWSLFLKVRFFLALLELAFSFKILAHMFTNLFSQ
jgi:hypothetical protein